MRKTFVLGLVLIFVCSLAVFAADNPASNLPKLILLNHEDIKIGKMGEHDALMRQLIQTANSSNANFHWISASSLTGNTSDWMGIGVFESHADIEKYLEVQNRVIKANLQNADFARQVEDSHQSRRLTIAHLRPDLCHHAEKVNLGSGRYWDITIFQVRPGADDDFEQLSKEYAELHDRGNIDLSWGGYQVEYGSSGPTYIFITPLKSLADLDVDREAAYKAVFTPGITRRFNAALREQVTEVKSMLLAMRPEISHPDQSLVAANPDFWTVKEETGSAATPAKTKIKGKKAPVEPAAMKEKDQTK